MKELKKRFESVWKDIAFSLPEIRGAIKQFLENYQMIYG